jgi:alpha-beta hydrolase superfamily lysophospholipase
VDLRGPGKSPGPRVHVPTFDRWVEDVMALRAHARAAAPALPELVLAHSMGALVALLAVHRAPDGLRGLVLTSPFLGVHPALRPGPARRALIALLARLAPALQVPSGADPSWVSRDPAVVAAYRGDPLVSRTVSPGWFRALGAAQAEAHAAAPGWTVPTLVLAAGDDRLVDLAATRAWLRRAPGIVESEILEGFFHEVLNEPQRARVWARAAAWMDAAIARG